MAKAFQDYGGLITDQSGASDAFYVYTSGVQTAPDLGSGWNSLMNDMVYTQ